MGRVASAGDNAAMESFWAYCRRTCSTGGAGAPATNSKIQSCSGSSTPTTDAAGSAHSTSTPRSSTNLPSPAKPLSQHDQSQPSSTEPAAVLSGGNQKG